MAKKRSQIKSGAQYVVYTVNGAPLSDEAFGRLESSIESTMKDIQKESPEVRLLLTTARG